MSLEYPCVYHENGKCLKHTEPDYVDYCVYFLCHEQTPSRGDRVRCMKDDELALFIADKVAAEFCERMKERGITPSEVQQKKILERYYFMWLRWLIAPAEVEE